MKKLLLYLLHSAYLALTAAPSSCTPPRRPGRPAWPAMLLLCGASFAGNAVSCFLRERRALFALLAAGLAAAGAALLPLFPWSLLLAAMNLVVALTGARRRWNEPETELVDARVMVAGLIVCAVVYLMGLFNGLPAVQARVGVLAYFYLVASLLLTNRQSVRTNAGGQARRMMRGNQALTWGFLAVLTLVAFFDALREAVGRGIRGALAALLRLIPQGQSAGTTESGGGMGEMDLSGPRGGDAPARVGAGAGHGDFDDRGHGPRSWPLPRLCCARCGRARRPSPRACASGCSAFRRRARRSIRRRASSC